jgi:VWFA-related protein
MRRIVAVLLAWGIAAPLDLLRAQETTFKVNTNLVVVNVAVRDKNGNIITNLKKEDFILLEDGKAQPVSIFELQKLEGETLPPVPKDGSPSTVVETARPAPVAAGATAATGKPGPIKFQDKRLLGLFFDFSSMSQPDQGRAIDAAVTFLREQMTSTDLVSIMTFANRFKMVQDFSSDRELLLDTLHKMSLGEGADLAADGSTGADEDDDSGGFTADDSEFNIFNTDRKLSALETAAKKLGVYAEKKALVYFSSGVGKTGMENQSQLRATINAAVRANVSFYPVDARGLVATPPAGDASTASPRGSSVFSGRAQGAQRDRHNNQQETLFTLAADTGGKALLDSNDLSLGIRQAQRDINSYYILGYYSNNESKDGRFRKIQVKLVNPQLQAKLDYRAGYYAQKTWAKFNSSDKERQLEEALVAGDPVSELPLALEIDYFRVAKDRYFVPVSAKIPGSAIALAKKKGGEGTELDFIGQVRDAKGKLVGGVRDTIPVKFTEESATQLAKRHLQYDAGLTLPPGDYTLKFLARENQTGKMGTFESNFTIPDLGGQGKGLRVSSVLWSNQKEKLSAAVGSADNNKKLIQQNPLVQDGQKFIPSITRVFRKDQNLLVYLEVYDPTLNEQKKPALVAELELLQGGRKVFASQPIRKNDLAASRLATVPFQFQIPLSRLNPGEYIAQVSVIDSQGRKFAFPRGAIVVLGN